MNLCFRHVAGFIFGVTLFFALPVSAQENTDSYANYSDLMKLEDVLVSVYDNNPTILAARTELLAVHESLPQALSGWKPNIDSEVEVLDVNTTIEGRPDTGATSRELSVSVSQPLFRGMRTVAETKEAQKLIEAQRAALRNQEQIVLLDAVTAYMNIVRDEALLELSENNRRVIDRELEATRNRFEFGELTKTDVSQAEARLARANADITSAISDLQRSRAGFERLTGVKPLTPGYPEVKFPFPETLEDAIATAEQNNPLIIAQNALYQSAQYDAEAVFGELLPEVNLLGSLSRTYDPQPGIYDEQDTSTIGVRASMPLYAAGNTRSRIRQAKHIANQQRIEIRESQRNVRESVISAWEEWHASRAEIESRMAQVEASEIARDGVAQENEFGQRTVLDLLDADQELLDSRTALISARRDEVVAQFTLAAALGMLGPQYLDLRDYTPVYDKHLSGIQSDFFGFDVDSVQ